MDWKSSALPGWGCFVVGVLGVVIQWRDAKNTSLPGGATVISYLPVVLVAVAIIGSALINWRAFHGKPKEHLEKTPGISKLRVHSAVYGTGPENDVDVTQRLLGLTADGLALMVDNNVLGIDPALGAEKRLEVVYSYGNPAQMTVSRPEGRRLVIPQDLWLEHQYIKVVSDSKKLQELYAPLADKVDENYRLYLEQVEEVKRLRVSERQVITEREAALRNGELLQTAVQEERAMVSKLATDISRLQNANRQTEIRIPDITGTVSAIYLKGYGHMVSGGEKRIHCDLKMDVSIHNPSQRQIGIERMLLMSTGERPCSSIRVQMGETPLPLSPANTYSSTVTARIEFDNDGSNTIPGPLALQLFDEHNGKHWIVIKSAIPSLPGDAPSATEAL